MKILEFLALNWSSVLLVLAIFAVIIVLYVRGEKKILDVILFAAVTEAEKQYKGGTGPLKKASVITKIYGIVPAILKIIISEEQIGRWIEDALEYAKIKWAENPEIKKYINNAEEPDEKPPDVAPEYDDDFIYI